MEINACNSSIRSSAAIESAASNIFLNVISSPSNTEGTNWLALHDLKGMGNEF